MTIESTSILITGMHRSGTSLVARILHLHGVAVPEDLEPANELNVTAYWESVALIALHDEMLKEAHSSWKDVGKIPQSWFKSDPSASYTKDISKMLLDIFQASPCLRSKTL